MYKEDSKSPVLSNLKSDSCWLAQNPSPIFGRIEPYSCESPWLSDSANVTRHVKLTLLNTQTVYGREATAICMAYGQTITVYCYTSHMETTIVSYLTSISAMQTKIDSGVDCDRDDVLSEQNIL